MTTSFFDNQPVSAQERSLDNAAHSQELPLSPADQNPEQRTSRPGETEASPQGGPHTLSPSTAGVPPDGAASENTTERIAEVPLEQASPTPLAVPDPSCGQLYADVRKMMMERTQLLDPVCGLVAFWAVATWFPEAFAVFPCLVLTGDVQNATTLLKTLQDICYKPYLLAGFRKGDLKVFAGLCTLLISEPNLDKRTAALLGSLTNRSFLITDKDQAVPGAGFRAVYIGEKQSDDRIEHSLFIDATAPFYADIPLPQKQASARVESLRCRLSDYRDRNLSKVESNSFRPTGLSSELSVIASILGSCMVDAPSLQQELLTLLQPTDQQALDGRQNSWEALVVGAAIKLADQQNEEIYVKQIVAEIAPQLDARGEKKTGRPERVGRKLSKLGLRSRKLSDHGNGLRLDPATRLRLHELGAVYGGSIHGEGKPSLFLMPAPPKT